MMTIHCNVVSFKLGSQDIKSHISPTHRRQNEKQEVGQATKSQVYIASSKASPPKFHDLTKQQHKLGTNCSSTEAYGRTLFTPPEVV